MFDFTIFLEDSDWMNGAFFVAFFANSITRQRDYVYTTWHLEMMSAAQSDYFELYDLKYSLVLAGVIMGKRVVNRQVHVSLKNNIYICINLTLTFRSVCNAISKTNGRKRKCRNYKISKIDDVVTLGFSN